jgi:putative ATPase
MRLLEESFKPLAERMGPRVIQDLKGLDHLLGEGKPLKKAMDHGALHIVLKTTTFN